MSAATAAPAATNPFTVLIPARMASSRLPDKPLADIAGLPMVVRVAQRAAQSAATRVVVAADDARILQACQAHGVQAIMTRPDHASGSDRLAQACAQLGLQGDDIVVNVQGDEPFLDPAGLTQIIDAALNAKPSTQVINAYSNITNEEDFRSVTVPKVVCSQDNMLLYASRAAIPTTKSLQFVRARRQIGMYAFSASALQMFAAQSSKTSLLVMHSLWYDVPQVMGKCTVS